LGGGAAMGRLLPKTTDAGSGASGLRGVVPAAAGGVVPAAAGGAASAGLAAGVGPGAVARLPSGEGALPARLRGGLLPGFCGDLSVCSVIF
jgi:hypothetical protein